MFLERIERILSEDKPRLERYRAEEDPEWPAWSALSIEDALERLRFLRGKIASLLGALSEAELERVGVHPLFGEMTLPMWLDFFLLHEAHHLYVIWSRARGA